MMNMEAQEAHGLRYRKTLGVLVIAGLSFAVLQTMVAPVLPLIQRDYGASTTDVTWVLTIYLLTATIATPVLGRLGDMRGRKRVLVIVLLIFAIGTLVCALAGSLMMLIVGRGIQGVGGAIFPLAFGIIRDEFPPRMVPGGIGIISATFGIGGIIGVAAAGVIVDQLGVPWIFWSALLVVGGAAAATYFLVPETAVVSRARLDVGGACLLAIGLTGALVAISEGHGLGWSSAIFIGLLVVSAIVLAAFVVYELRVSDPLVDMRMMRQRGVWTTNTTGFIVGFGMFGSLLLIPQLVQVSTEHGFGFGASVTGAGLFLLPSAVGMVIGGPAAGWIATTFGSRLPLLIGILCAGAGFAALALWHSDPWNIYVISLVMGLGLGLSWSAMATLIVQAVEPSQTSVAAGMNAIARSCGGALSAQVAASILGAGAVAGIPAESGFVTASAMCAGALALAFAVGLLIPRNRPPLRLRWLASEPNEAGSPV